MQQALSAARDGDTVLVAPGEYHFSDSLTFEGKGLRLVSEAGPAETTLGDGSIGRAGLFAKLPLQRASVIIFENAEPPGTLVKGFTITSGGGSDVQDICGRGYDDPLGGGIFVFRGASVTIEDCTIRGNKSNGGGGVSCLGGSVVIRDCNVSGNSAWLSNPGAGGGLYCLDGGEAYLERCSLSGNYAQVGSGLTLSCGSKVTAISCKISENKTNENGSGAGVTCGGSELILENCTLSNNCRLSSCLVAGAMTITEGSRVELRNCLIEGSSAEAYAGGISVRSGSTLVLRGSTIRGCSSEESGAIDCVGGHIIMDSSILEGNSGLGAGGLLLQGDSSAVLQSCLIVGNSYSGVEARGHCKLEVVGCTIADNCESGLVCWSTSEVTIRNSILWRNGYELCGGGVNLAYQGQEIAVIHTLVGGSQLWPGEGNLNVDPLFGESQDYHLMPGSPAIDAGSHDGASDRDLEGHPRPCGGGVDLGAYEFGSCELKQFRRGDTDGSGRLELTDAIVILGYLFLGQSTPSCLDAADVDDDGQLIVVDAIYLLRNIFLGGAAPPAPSEACGVDPTVDTISCLEDLSCGV